MIPKGLYKSERSRPASQQLSGIRTDVLIRSADEGHLRLEVSSCGKEETGGATPVRASGHEGSTMSIGAYAVQAVESGEQPTKITLLADADAEVLDLSGGVEIELSEGRPVDRTELARAVNDLSDYVADADDDVDTEAVEAVCERLETELMASGGDA